MFTKYRGIEIPQNYSGSRFSVPPPETEMKTHRPSSVYAPSKTSISPIFQASLDAKSKPEIDNFADNVYKIEENSYDNQYQPYNEFDTESQDIRQFNEPSKSDENVNKKASVFEEFKPLVSSFLKNISSEDLLLLSLVILLLGDGGDGASELILPLLCLFLYR